MSDNFQSGVKAGATSVSIPIVCRKTADNTEKTGLVYNTAGNIASYWRQGGSRVAITLATLASPSAAYSSGGFVEVDATNQPGLYRLDVPDAAFASGADWVVVSFVSTGQYVYHEKFQITSNKIQTADVGVQVPTALTYDASNLLKVDVEDWKGTAPNALASGRVDASVGSYPGNTAQTGDAYARLGAPANASVSADIAAAKSDTAAIKSDVENATTGLVNIEAIAAAIKAKTDNLPATPASTGDAMALTAAERTALSNALLDLANAIETGVTPRLVLQRLAAVAGGTSSGMNPGGGTAIFNSMGGTTARVSAVLDVNGNRQSVTFP